MNLEFQWQEPILIARNKKVVVDDSLSGLDIGQDPGVYYFARHFGQNSEPFYIGQSDKLKTRICQHLRNRDMYRVLCGELVSDAPRISNGSRHLHFAYLVRRPGPQPEKALRRAERLLIRLALDRNLPLLNQHGTLIRYDTIVFKGKMIFREGMRSRFECPSNSPAARNKQSDPLRLLRASVQASPYAS